MIQRKGSFRWRVLIAMVCLGVMLIVPSVGLGAGLVPVYRFYNVTTGTHFYTASEAEKADVIARYPTVLRYEGVAYNLNTDSPAMNKPLYRFYNVNTATHFYTVSEAEKAHILATYPQFRLDGIAYYVSDVAAGNAPVYRFYNLTTATHFYTASEAEKADVIARYPSVLRYEGPAFYLAGGGGPIVAGADTTPPTTLSDAMAMYRGTAIVRLSAADNVGGSGVAHTYYMLNGGMRIEGTTVFTTGLGDHTLEFWSVDAAGNVETHHVVNFTIVSVHSSPTASASECTVCHSADLMTIHQAPAGPGCVACHGTGVTPSALCTDCHDFTPDMHPGLDTAHDATGESCVAAGCHVTDVSVIHDTMLSNGLTPPGCPACHGAGVTPSTVCANCHPTDFDLIHGSLTAAHAVTGPCYNASCHVNTGPGQSDAALIHASWANPPGCAACHAPGVTPSLTCFGVACHGAGGATVDSVHNYAHVDASGTGSGACTACHGTQLPEVHAAVGCICHTAPYLIAEMEPLLDAGTSECVDCHTDMYAPHYFAQTAEAPSASGHNTTSLGRMGAYTLFDGTEGIVVRDAGGSIITTAYPLPTQNVFWELGDPEAPEGAITGLTWDSVITCEDCHTGLVEYEIEGPHGAQTIANVGIDPAFPGEYENAALWAWQAPLADGTHVSAYPTAENVFAKSGIVQYVPGGSDTTRPSAYAMMTYLTGFAMGETTVTVPGPASIERPDSVICSKCHDLHNPGTGHNALGDGITGDGYAHYHGHDYHDDPVRYAGLYQRSDDTTYTAFMKEAEADVQVIGPSAGRGASGHCRNCHVAIPHGWKRPRLLVYETDPAPFNIGPSVEYAGSAAEGRYYRFADYGTAHPEGGQLKGISSIWGPQMSHEGEVGEYVNWQNDGRTTCQACGHHYAEPTPGSMWE